MPAISLFLRTAMVVLACCAGAAPVAATEQFDVVIRDGRVMDPESGLDAIRDVGIVGDRIVRISDAPLKGRKVIDATGRVVTAGFIELHQHGFKDEDYRLLAMDGVTTALELEIGVPDIDRFLAAQQGRSPIHFGASASYLAARVRAWHEVMPASSMGPEAGIVPVSGAATNDASTAAQMDSILDTLRDQIQAGALGVGIGLEYAPGTTRHDLIRIFRAAAEIHSPVFIHARSSGIVEPGSGIEAVAEVIGAAAISGAAVHIVHINSTCMRDAPECLTMISGARERGLDITTEAYPYTVAMTGIQSAYFNPGWREKRGLDYDSLEIPETGERLTRERFETLRTAPDPSFILIHANPDAVVDGLLPDPRVIVASDGALNHPRGAGTRARFVARYVRDQKSLGLMDALRKMSLLPAQRLEPLTPLAKDLGRIREGARADIVVFDADEFADQATYREPTRPSAGVHALLVAGTLVVDRGKLRAGIMPGQPLLRENP